MKNIMILAAALLFSAGAYAQIEHPVKWSYAAKKTSPTEAVLFLKATMEKGWHIYSLHVKDGGPIRTSFTFAPSKEYSLLGKPTEPTPKTMFVKDFNMNVSSFDKEVIFKQKIKLKSANALVIKGKLEYMVCNDVKCLPPEELAFAIPVSK